MFDDNGRRQWEVRFEHFIDDEEKEDTFVTDARNDMNWTDAVSWATSEMKKKYGPRRAGHIVTNVTCSRVSIYTP